MIDKKIFKEFKEMPPEQRAEYLEGHIKKYTAIVLGNDTEYNEENLKYIYHAISSPKLNMTTLKRTLSEYGEKAAALPATKFRQFSLKTILEIADIKIKGTFTKGVYNYYSEIFGLFLETKKIPQVDLLELFKENKKMDIQILNCEYSQEICWRVLLYQIFQKLGADMKDKIENFCKKSFEEAKQDLFGFRDYYHAIFELYNDTVKDHVAVFGKQRKSFLALHRRVSQIDKLDKELKKFKEIKGKNDVNIICIPSKKPLDLFYGYYGENCTSEFPQELFNDKFTPFRMINNNEIQGCLHFVNISYKGKKILGILGIEPRSHLVNHVNNKLLFNYIIKAIIKEAKHYNYDAVGLPKNTTMHSNRGEIGKLIGEKIRNIKLLPIDFNFPKGMSGCTTKGIAIIWER